MFWRLRRWWRERVRGIEAVPDDHWARLCGDTPVLDGMTPDELGRLRGMVGEFLYRKAVVGAGGLEVDDGMRLVIAAQACIPVLELGLDWYDGWVSVIVYPDEFVARQEYVDEDGVVHELERELTGESWDQGPVILSWRHSEDGALGEDWGNVVIHEFAHKLDQLNGPVNGMPPLHPGMDRGAWTRDFTDAYQDFCRRVEADEAVPFDDYAAHDPGEFFAVLSEAFFVYPFDVLDAYPAVYDRLREFYRQDPAARLEAVLAAEGEGSRGP